MKRFCVTIALAMCVSASFAGPNEPRVNFVPASKLLTDVQKAPENPPNVRVLTYLSSPGYSAIFVRRDKPGKAELHTKQLDIWYVVEGSGTLVTGGSLVDSKDTEPGEVRGKSISGGTTRHLAKGDFATIPANVPHWISAIDGKEIIYMVVKVTESPAGK